MSIDERAIWHESGHAVVALSLGFPSADILFKNGNLEATHVFARVSEVPTRRVCVLLTAGAAAEKLIFGGYSPAGSSADAARISELGGTMIEDYLAEATGVLEAHRPELQSVFQGLRESYTRRLLGGRPSVCVLMSAEEVVAAYGAGALARKA